MKDPNVTTRAYRDTDLEQAVALIREIFPPDYGVKDVAWWQWKHLSNPLGPSVIIVAESGGRIVGTHTLLQWPIWLRNRRGVALQSTDTVVHSDYRRRGLFAAMVSEALATGEQEGGGFVFNFPTNMSVSGFPKFGWQQEHPLRWLYKPIQIAGTLRRISKLLLHPMYVATCPKLSGAIEIPILLNDEPEALESFLERRRSHASGWAGTFRSAPFYRWRYADHPHHNYVCMAERRGADITALAIVKMDMPGAYVCATLADFLAIEIEDGLSLLRNLRSLATDSGIDLLIAIRPPAGVIEREALRLAGFRAFPRRLSTFTTRSLTARTRSSEEVAFEIVAGDIIAV